MNCTNHVEVSEGVRPCARCGKDFCGDCLVTILGLPYCATCKSEKLLDVQSGTDSSVLQLATIGRRFAAQVIDSFVVSIPAFALFFAFIFFGVATTNNARRSPPPWIGFAFIAVFLLIMIAVVAYEALMLQWRGQTLGKMLLRIRVVRPDGTPISAGQAWGRAVIRVVMVHVLSLINYIPAFVTREKTCVHDMAARTRVVSAE
jgi:uncharacterized RDD family membrane protein YckC